MVEIAQVLGIRSGALQIKGKHVKLFVVGKQSRNPPQIRMREVTFLGLLH